MDTQFSSRFLQSALCAGLVGLAAAGIGFAQPCLSHRRGDALQAETTRSPSWEKAGNLERIVTEQPPWFLFSFGTPCEFGSPCEGEGQFAMVSGVAAHPNGNIYVSDYTSLPNTIHHRVQVFDSNGNYLFTFGSEGRGDGNFYGAGGITIDNQGFVYVCDRYNDRVQKFTPDGQFVMKFTAGMLNQPNDVAVDDAGHVWVTTNSKRLYEYGSDGQFIRETDRTPYGMLDYVCGLATDGQKVYAGEYYTGGIHVFSEEGVYERGIQTIGHILDIEIGNGFLIITDPLYQVVRKVTLESEQLCEWGGQGTSPGQFLNISYATKDKAGNIYVGDYSRGHVNKYSLLPISVRKMTWGKIKEQFR